MCDAKRHVCFTPESGHPKNGLMQRNKNKRYSITSPGTRWLPLGGLKLLVPPLAPLARDNVYPLRAFCYARGDSFAPSFAST